MKLLLLLILTVAVILMASLIKADEASTRPTFCEENPGTGCTGRPQNSSIRWSYYPDLKRCSMQRWGGCVPHNNIFMNCSECAKTCAKKEPKEECDGYD
uniref:Pancreatic trypsin inhibitor n=1 Tax=Rhipicephalus zambeziensis TaxID=60191 RepID=A0A224Y2F0_9ACAR